MSVGAKAGIDGRDILVNSVREAITTLTDECADIKTVLASGMITSEFGLYKVDHIHAPAGIKELHDSICTVNLAGISDIPFSFIPGIILSGNNLSQTDMMRGEETELVGLNNELEANCIYVLPGSHSKIIQLDSLGRICRFSTMLTGEMIYSLTENTILKSVVDLNQKETDNEYLIKGYEYCESSGINETLFKVRVLNNVYNCSKKQIYSFFMGAVLHDEIKKICQLEVPKVIIGGKNQIKKATHTLITHYSDKNAICAPDESADNAASRGAIKIFEYQWRLVWIFPK